MSTIPHRHTGYSGGKGSDTQRTNERRAFREAGTIRCALRSCPYEVDLSGGAWPEPDCTSPSSTFGSHVIATRLTQEREAEYAEAHAYDISCNNCGNVWPTRPWAERVSEADDTASAATVRPPDQPIRSAGHISFWDTVMAPVEPREAADIPPALVHGHVVFGLRGNGGSQETRDQESETLQKGGMVSCKGRLLSDGTRCSFGVDVSNGPWLATECPSDASRRYNLNARLAGAWPDDRALQVFCANCNDGWFTGPWTEGMATGDAESC